MENEESAMIPHVLLVEDDDLMRLLIRKRLEKLGVKIDEAENGLVGLEKWRLHHHQLIISDCHMPIMDGFQMAGAIRRQENSDLAAKKTQIVALSADTTIEMQTKCKDIGIDSYFIKPASLEQLRTIVDKHRPVLRL